MSQGGGLFDLQWQGNANLLRVGTRNSTFATGYITTLIDDLTPQNQTDMVKYNVHECVTVNLENYLNDTRLHVQGLTLLMALARDNVQSQHIMLKAGVHREVLKSMDVHRSKAEVQSAGCGVLKQLLHHYDGDDGHLGDALVKSIVDANIHTAIQRAMKKHPQDLSLQHRAINALWALVETAPTTKLNIVKDGVHLNILQAMRRFPDNEKLIYSAVGCIHELVKGDTANSASIAARLDTDHVAMELQKAMNQFSKDQSIQKECKMALEIIESTGVVLAHANEVPTKSEQSATDAKKKTKKFGLF